MNTLDFDGLDWDGIRWTCGSYEIRRTCCSWYIFKGDESYGRFADFMKAAQHASQLRTADMLAEQEQLEAVEAPQEQEQ